VARHLAFLSMRRPTSNPSFHLTTRPQDHNFRLAGDGRRSRAPCQSNLSLAVRDQVLIERGHTGIRRFGLYLRARSERAASAATSTELANAIILSVLRPI
jgi:hypothetical protein